MQRVNQIEPAQQAGKSPKVSENLCELLNLIKIRLLSLLFQYHHFLQLSLACLILYSHTKKQRKSVRGSTQLGRDLHVSLLFIKPVTKRHFCHIKYYPLNAEVKGNYHRPSGMITSSINTTVFSQLSFGLSLCNFSFYCVYISISCVVVMCIAINQE